MYVRTDGWMDRPEFQSIRSSLGDDLKIIATKIFSTHAIIVNPKWQLLVQKHVIQCIGH